MNAKFCMHFAFHSTRKFVGAQFRQAMEFKSKKRDEVVHRCIRGAYGSVPRAIVTFAVQPPLDLSFRCEGGFCSLCLRVEAIPIPVERPTPCRDFVPFSEFIANPSQRPLTHRCRCCHSTARRRCRINVVVSQIRAETSAGQLPDSQRDESGGIACG